MQRMSFARISFATFVLLLLTGTDTCVAQQLQTDAALQKQLQAIVAAHHGKVALYARQLNTGKTVGIDQEMPVATASTIKLAMLLHAVTQVAEGKAHWDEKITFKEEDRVGGSGILPLLDAPLTLTLKDTASLMVVLSDNTATNLMIDRFTTKAVDDHMVALGLPETILYKKSFKPAVGPMPPDQPKYGLGKTTPRQIATVIGRIGTCDLGPTMAPREAQLAACGTALKMLKNQFYRDGISRYLETADPDPAVSGEAVASKSGSLDATRSDVAIIAAKTGPILLSVYTYDNADKSWTADTEAMVTIAKVAQAVVKAWSPAGVNGKLLVPGLGQQGLAWK
jgi:beta-lactamase class A